MGDSLSAGRAALVEAVRRSSARAVARRVGVDESSLREWLSGESSPTAENRKKLRAAGIVGAWRAVKRASPEAAPEPAPEKVANGTPVEEGPLDARRELERTVRDLQGTMGRLQSDKGATSRELASVSSSLVRAARELNRMNGSEITIPQILRSLEWRRLQSTIIEALRPVPGAREALTTALRALEAP